jgi:hypothetical protein
MLTPTTLEIAGQTYTIGQLPADAAFDVACIVAEWRARQSAEYGEGVGSLEVRPGGDAMATEIPIGRIMAGEAKARRVRAQMLRDSEYRKMVWDRVLSLCTGPDNVPVLRPDWTTRFAGERLADLFALHEAAIEHSCGPFLRRLGVEAPGQTGQPPA